MTYTLEYFKEKLDAGTLAGVYENVPNDIYHQLSQIGIISSSQIKAFAARSPFHYKYGPKKNIDGRVGTAVHTKFLEPHLFGEEVIVEPEINKRFKSEREKLEEFRKENEGKTIISKMEMEAVEGMTDSLNRYAHHLGGARVETTIIWQCPYTGLWFRCRPDALTKYLKLLELKTSQDASPDGFSRLLFKFGYHLSLVHYKVGIEQVMGETLNGGFFLVVENTPPYVAAEYPVLDAHWEIGHHQWIDSVVRLAECMQSGVWPGYEGELILPAWEKRKYLTEVSDEVVEETSSEF